MARKPTTVHVDFETFSELDLTVVGSFRYAEDPSTEALILGYSLDDEDPVAVDLTAKGFLAKLSPLFRAIEQGARFVAHNVTFERNIWTKVCKFPVNPKPEQWDCTAVRSRLLAMPGSLDGAAAALGIDDRKDPRGMELINIFCKPQKNGKRIRSTDNPAAFREFMDYCRQDVRVEIELDKILPPTPREERDAFLLDYTINDRGMPVNMDQVNRALEFVEEYSAVVLESAVKIAGCKPTQREKTLEFLKSRGYPLPNLQAATVEALALEDGLPADLKDLMNSRIELSRAGTKKLVTIKACASEDGRIRGGFLFSAASTRRWSSVGVQMHNLQKPSGDTDPDVVLDMLATGHAHKLHEVFARPLTSIAGSIRGFFESKKHLHVADYGSVEPRGLAWSAEEKWLLDAYWNKQDAYKIAAGKVFGIAPEQVNKDQRFLGKQLVLGCGYGMGPPRFIQSCKQFGVTISEQLANQSVYGYRDSVPAITRFWKQIEACAIKAVRYWKPISFGRFKFRPITLSNGYPILMLDMPSGSIAYPNPSIETEEWYGEPRAKLCFYSVLGSTFHKTDTFGGSLTENVIQALTRDILRDGMVKAEKAGHYLIGHCHDEAIAEGEDSEEDLKDLEEDLCTASEWAEGFPIVTEGYLAKRYKK